MASRRDRFEWQEGKTIRFIKFEDAIVVEFDVNDDKFYVLTGNTQQIVPIEHFERFYLELRNWQKPCHYSATPSIPK
jgi:hypothetical protein